MLLWLVGLDIGWDCLVSHCIMTSRDQWEFPLFFRPQWLSLCTAFYPLQSLSLGLCKGTVKESNFPGLKTLVKIHDEVPTPPHTVREIRDLLFVSCQRAREVSWSAALLLRLRRRWAICPWASIISHYWDVTWTASWDLKSPATQLFAQQIVQHDKKSKLHISSPVRGEYTGDRWIPLPKGQKLRRHCHVITSSCVVLYTKSHFISDRLYQSYGIIVYHFIFFHNW